MKNRIVLLPIPDLRSTGATGRGPYLVVLLRITRRTRLPELAEDRTQCQNAYHFRRPLVLPVKNDVTHWKIDIDLCSESVT